MLPPDNRPIIAANPAKPSFLGNTKATLRAFVNPEGKATTFHFEYVTQASFETEGGCRKRESKSPPRADRSARTSNCTKQAPR